MTSIPPISPNDDVPSELEDAGSVSSQNFNSFLYMESTSEARINLKQELFEGQQVSLSNLISSALTYIQRALGKALITTELLTAVATWRSIRSAQDTQNGLINTYNTTSKATIQARVNAVNVAQAAWIATPTPATQLAYENAIDQYNATVAPIINAYDTSRATYKTNTVDKIPDLNVELAKLGIPTLPAIAQLPAATSGASITTPATISKVPLPTAAQPSPVNNLASITPITSAPSDSQAINLYLGNAMKLFDDSFNTTLPANLATNNKFALDEHNIDDVTLPIAYTKRTRTPAIFFNAFDGVQAGATTSMITTVLGLNSRVLDRILSRAIFSAFQFEGRKVLNPRQIDQIQLFALAAAEEAANAAAANAATRLGGRTVSPAGRRNIFNFASAAVFGDSIHDIVSSDAIPKGLSELFNSSPAFSGLSEAEKAALLRPTAAAVGLSLSQISLLYAASSIRAPGIVAHVLGNVPGVSLTSLAASDSSTQLNDVLDNPQKQVALKESLTEQLVEQSGLSTAQAEVLINKGVNNVLAQGLFNSYDQFQAALEQSLVDQGIEDPFAANLSRRALAFLNKEIALPFLDGDFAPGVLTGLVSSASEAAIVSLAKSLTNIIATNERIEEEAAEKIVNNAIANARRARPLANFDLLAREVEHDLSLGTLGDQTLEQIRKGINATQPTPVASLAEAIRGFPPGALNNDILLNASAAGISDPSIARAIGRSLSTRYESTREFYTDFIRQLQAEKIPGERAVQIADDLVRPLQTPTAENTNPLQNRNISKPLDNAALAEAITKHTVESLKPYLGDAGARKEAEPISRVIVGTILSDIIKEQEILKSEQREASKEIGKSFHAVSSPNPGVETLPYNIQKTMIAHPEVALQIDPSRKEDFRKHYTQRDDEFTVRV